MGHVTAVFLGALIGSAFSFTAAYLYIAGIRRIGPKVFQTWRILLLLPVHFVFAFTLSAPMFFPFFALGVIGASFPLTNAAYALAISFGILGAVPPFTYFFRQWHRLRGAGYWHSRGSNP
ncbi:MAG: hypothetical protein DME33_04795 [Verrucomicrobia bacterium]|nr:MAG: hypothetical protein DME33_04795 [Verrucomicrobiota bacterium]